MEKIETLTKMFEYNLYANLAVIDICNELTAEQLAFKTDGGFGAIKPTLAHLVAAEGGYIRRLSGAPFWPEDLDTDTWHMADIRDWAEKTGSRLIELATSVDPGVTHTIDFPVEGPHQGKRFQFYNWTLLLQALHHGGEHRTHVKVLLTHLGIEHPDLSAWTYMEVLHGYV